jgi:hypothetical protein
MALTKEVVIDKIEVTENGVVQVRREATRIVKDGEPTMHKLTIEAQLLRVKIILTKMQK